MSSINIILRTADKTRKAEIQINTDNTGADIIEGAVDNWALPTDTDYNLVNTTTEEIVNPNSALGDNGVRDGHVLEIQPVLVAG
ncbi:MAG: hypothetical protein OXD32_08110 [Endozoicomonadaceae bacterium]|nr:hypothetical protein [Endozoicomonadaceae bacterium]MCY4329657.1 hypothetical protein [Endozoicomonadaceae bacterium]